MRGGRLTISLESQWPRVGVLFEFSAVQTVKSEFCGEDPGGKNREWDFPTFPELRLTVAHRCTAIRPTLCLQD